MTTKDLEQQARDLIAKWRAERAKSYPSDSVTQSGYDAALKRCADELEAMLNKEKEKNSLTPDRIATIREQYRD